MTAAENSFAGNSHRSSPRPSDEDLLRMPQPATSKLAIASLILGIACIFLGPLSAVPALILGIIALRRIKQSPGVLRGRGCAIGGVVTAVVFPIVIVAVFLLAVVFQSLGPKLRGRRPEAILQAARLADLPQSATSVRAQGWSSIFSGANYLVFQAAPEDINNWIAQSSSINGGIPEAFDSNHMHLPYEPNREYDTDHKYYVPMPSNPQWYDLTIKVKGRKYEIPGDPGGHNWGTVIINDHTNTVFINVIWS